MPCLVQASQHGGIHSESLSEGNETLPLFVPKNTPEIYAQRKCGLPYSDEVSVFFLFIFFSFSLSLPIPRSHSLQN